MDKKSRHKGGKGGASSSKPAAESLGTSVWFGGATLALVVVAILSTALPKTCYTHIIGGIAFLYFGAKLLADSRVNNNKKKSRAKKTKRAEEAADEDDMPPLENVYGEDARLATSSNVIPSDASCFLCLDEGPDEDGQPLMRDCSCRGDSGVTHFKCLVDYTKDKSSKLARVIREQGSGEAFTTPWLECCSCHQEYQNALALKLMDALIPFTIESFPCNAQIQCPEFPCDPVAYAEALRAKSDVLYSMMHLHSDRASHRTENKKINEEILVVVTTLKEHPRNGFGPSIPPAMIGLEARAHQCIGVCIVEIEMDGGYRGEIKSAMEHFQKSRALYTSIEDNECVAQVDQNIATTKSMLSLKATKDIFNVTDETKSGGRADILLKQYKEEPDADTAKFLVLALRAEKRKIECDRFISEHLALSRRIHGPIHTKTRFMEAQLKEVRIRLVSLRSDNCPVLYEPRRYEDDGKKCVLWGPFGEAVKGGASIVQYKEEGKKTIIANTTDLFLLTGTPVVCHGLKNKNASHLNGKIGDTRSFDKERERYSVHFEDSRLKPCLVREQNLRILFDLPPKEH